VKADRFIVALRRDVDDDLARDDGLDCEAERRASDSVEDQVEVAGDLLRDVSGAEAAEDLL
jgi:hypothetical protein